MITAGLLGGQNSTDAANSVFEQPWWLDAVAPGRWYEARVVRGGELAARMPFVVGPGRLFTSIVMPPLTQALGPWLRPSSAKYHNQLAEQKELMEELIVQLPRVDSFYHHLSPRITNWLPFHWAGFRQTTRYTYRIPNLSDLDAVWVDLRENIRREIRKARKLVAVRDDLSLERFIQVNRMTFERQGMELPYDPELVRRVDSACAARGVRRMLVAEDSSGRIHAAVYIVWDSDLAYYILGGADPELRTSGAHSLLMWEAIQFASTVTRGFDFKGTMLESIERFFRAFGARQVPFHQLTRFSPRMQAVRATGELADAILGQAKSLSGPVLRSLGRRGG